MTAGFFWEGIEEAGRLVVSGDAGTYHAVWVSFFCTVVAITAAGG